MLTINLKTINNTNYQFLKFKLKNVSIVKFRDLSTEIELMLTTSMLPAKCHVLIEETIPRGMYVDPNQLRDLSESQGLQTYVAGTSINI